MKLTMAVDFYDMVWVSEEIFDESHIDKFIKQCAENGINRLLWRVSVGGKLFYHTRTPDRLSNFRSSKTGKRCDIHREISKKAMAVMEKCDPLKVAVDCSRKHGIEIYPWLTIYDDWSYMGELKSSLLQDNPNFSWVSQDGSEYLWGATSYVYDEVVEFRMRQIKELLSYDVDGLHLSLRSHSRPPEYIKILKAYLEANPCKTVADYVVSNKTLIKKIMKESHGTYGFEPQAVSEYSRITGKIPDKHDPEWWKFRGGYLLRFLKQVRNVVNTREIGFSLWWRTPYYPPFPNEFYRWDDIVSKNIVDELCYVLPNDFSKIPGCYPELVNHNKNSSLWLFTSDNTENVYKRFKIIEKALRSRLFQNVCLYEAMDFYKNPNYWKMVKKIKNINPEAGAEVSAAGYQF